MRALPEEARVRKSVAAGIGRAVQELYAQEHFKPLPDHLMALLARIDKNEGLGEPPAQEHSAS